MGTGWGRAALFNVDNQYQETINLWGGMSVKNEDDKKTVLLVNITWNPDGWKRPYCNPKAGHEYARKHPGHESLNFKFDKKIDTEGLIHGYFQPVGGWPKDFCDKGIIIFFTTNGENGRGEIVGIYGMAQIIDTISYTCKGFENDTGAANIRAEERYSMQFPIPLSAAEYDPEKYKYVGAKKLLGQSGFSCMLDAFAKDIILDEINELKKYGTKYDEALIKLKGIYEHYFGKLPLKLRLRGGDLQQDNDDLQQDNDEQEQDRLAKVFKNKTKKELRDILSSATDSPDERVTVESTRYKRNNVAISAIKEYRGFKCQICGKTIIKKDGSNYIEAAHIKAKHKGGKETLDNILLLCPNHHKEFDLGDSNVVEHTEHLVKLKIGKEVHTIDLR